MIKIILIVIVLIHGLLHLLGFFRSFSKEGVISLPGYMPRSHGLLWLICSLLFILADILIIFRIQGWIFFMGAALVISQVLIILSWKEARFGSLTNILILVLSVLQLNNFQGL